MKDFFDRLDKYISYNGLNDNQVTVKAGLSVGALGKQRKGSRGLSSESIAKLLYAFDDLNSEWLLTGKGDMLKTKEMNQPEKIVIHPVLDSKTGIPLIGLDVAAGFGSAEFAIREQDIQEFYVVPDFNGIDFMIRVKGNSMYPKYSSGDIIACRKIRENTFIQWNKCHVIATTEQGLLVKRLKKSQKENHIVAISDNQEYDPFEIPKDEITGIALVIGVIRLE